MLPLSLWYMSKDALNQFSPTPKLSSHHSAHLGVLGAPSPHGWSLHPWTLPAPGSCSDKSLGAPKWVFTSPAKADGEHLEQWGFLTGFLVIGRRSSSELPSCELGLVTSASTFWPCWLLSRS